MRRANSGNTITDGLFELLPDILTDNKYHMLETSLGNPAALTPVLGAERSGEYVLNFDPSGADAEFIRNVPLKYSSTGAEGSFTTQLPSGWVCQKTDSQIRLTSMGSSGSLYLMFDVRGTRYASGGGTFSSPEEVYVPLS